MIIITNLMTTIIIAVNSINSDSSRIMVIMTVCLVSVLAAFKLRSLNQCLEKVQYILICCYMLVCNLHHIFVAIKWFYGFKLLLVVIYIIAASVNRKRV